MTSPNDQNAPSESEQLHNFMTSVNEGRPVSEVDPVELRRFHKRLVEEAPYLKPITAISMGVMAPGMSPTEAGPLWLRNVFLGFLANQGVLAEWQRESEFDDAVFRVAATIPLNGLELDAEDFVARLRAEGT